MRVRYFLAGLVVFLLLMLPAGYLYNLSINKQVSIESEQLKKSFDRKFVGFEKVEKNSEKGAVIYYIPKVADKEKKYFVDTIEKDILNKDKGYLSFYYAKKEDNNFLNTKKYVVYREDYSVNKFLLLKKNKIERDKQDKLSFAYVDSKGDFVTLDKLFLDKNKFLTVLVDNVNKKLTAENVKDNTKNKIVDYLKKVDFSKVDFDYENKNLIIYLRDFPEYNKISVEFKNFYDVVNANYLISDELEGYKKYEAKKNGKVVALTFDDGPRRETTPKVLEILKKNNIHATFFMMGRKVAGNEDIVKRVKEEGHVIGNHSFTHPVLSKLPLEAAKKEINDTNEVLKNVTGDTPNLMRPPYGAINDNIKKEIDMAFIMWNVDTLDWKTKNPVLILKEVKRQTRPGSIILMHDVHQTTIDGLQNIINYLKEQGYTFVTVPEILEGRLTGHKAFFSKDE